LITNPVEKEIIPVKKEKIPEENQSFYSNNKLNDYNRSEYLNNNDISISISNYSCIEDQG
jgi:hypothetical protein